MSHGQFSGDPQTIWCTEAGPDRKMELIEDFWFHDGKDQWDAPKTTKVDGASIPQALWALVGSPYTGDYRRASIVHDVACVEAGTNHQARKAADRMFYHACRAGGCNMRESIILYVGVRIGAWWNEHGVSFTETTVKIHESGKDCAIRQDFQVVADDVLDPGETDDVDVIEKRTDAAMALRLAGRT